MEGEGDLGAFSSFMPQAAALSVGTVTPATFLVVGAAVS